MGRIFTAFLFIIIPFVKLFAADSVPSCWTWDSSEETCNSQEGCHYDSSDENAEHYCIACDPGDDTIAGHYGPGCNSQCDSITDSSNSSTTISGFRFGHRYYDDQNNAVRGARTMYECYKRLDGNSSAGTGHGPRCKDENDTDIEYSENDLQCRQYYRESGTYVSCNGNAGTDSDGTLISPPNNTGYHMEESVCYKNTRKCNKFIISSGDQNQCITSDSSHQNRTIYSDAVLTWDTGTQEWQANSSCKCRVEGDFSDQHCNGFKEFYNTGMVNSSTVSAQLIFRNNSSYGATTHCTGCLAGYYANGDTGDSFNCVPAPQGYYSTGCGTKWTDDNPTESSTQNCTLYSGILKPCYAGMTSNSAATSVQGCYYTDQTQFCDAWGCTSYSNLVGSNEDNWWWYMRESTGSSGSVDSSNDEIPIDVTPFD